MNQGKGARERAAAPVRVPMRLAVGIEMASRSTHVSAKRFASMSLSPTCSALLASSASVLALRSSTSLCCRDGGTLSASKDLPSSSLEQQQRLAVDIRGSLDGPVLAPLPA